MEAQPNETGKWMRDQRVTTPDFLTVLKNLLFLPVGCLSAFSPYLMLAAAAVMLLAGVFTFYNVNTNLLGIGAPDFANLLITNNSETIQQNGYSWNITYEKTADTTFTGLVRHVSPIRLSMMPFLTHDILVTMGDYADASKVTTSVVSHHFQWAALTQNHPQGEIHLLHTVPRNAEIYQQLLAIRTGQQVVITGHEILKIEAFDPSGQFLGNWQDSGCNSLMVDSVLVQQP